MKINVEISNETYDRIKIWVSILLPALITFVCLVLPLWGIEYDERIVGTLSASLTLVGTFMTYSSKQYGKTHQMVDIPKTEENDADQDYGQG